MHFFHLPVASSKWTEKNEKHLTLILILVCGDRNPQPLRRAQCTCAAGQTSLLPVPGTFGSRFSWRQCRERSLSETPTLPVGIDGVGPMWLRPKEHSCIRLRLLPCKLGDFWIRFKMQGVYQPKEWGEGPRHNQPHLTNLLSSSSVSPELSSPWPGGPEREKGGGRKMKGKSEQ